VPVEELDVRVQVLVEVAPRRERPGDGLRRVDDEADPEEDGDAERSRREALEPSEETARAPPLLRNVGDPVRLAGASSGRSGLAGRRAGRGTDV